MAALDADTMRDLRALGRVPAFSGDDAQWSEFRFSFRTYMALVAGKAEDLFDAAETAPRAIPLDGVAHLDEADPHESPRWPTGRSTTRWPWRARDRR